LGLETDSTKIDTVQKPEDDLDAALLQRVKEEEEEILDLDGLKIAQEKIEEEMKLKDTPIGKTLPLCGCLDICCPVTDASENKAVIDIIN
jgi:hypothetical protein